MKLAFKQDKTYIGNSGTCTIRREDKYFNWNKNGEGMANNLDMTEEEWAENIYIEIEDSSEAAMKVMKGWTPQLTQAGKLSKTMTKGEHLLAKEAKVAEKEQKETRKAELKDKLENDTITDAEIKEALKLALN